MIIRGTRYNVVRPSRLTPAQGGAFAAPVGSPVPPNDADRGVEPHHPTPARVEREEARNTTTSAAAPQGFGLGAVPERPERPREPGGQPTYENTRGHFYDIGPCVPLPDPISPRGHFYDLGPCVPLPDPISPREAADGIIRLTVTCRRQRALARAYGASFDRLDLFARAVAAPPLLASEDIATAVSPETGYMAAEITDFFIMNGPRKLRNLLITGCDPGVLQNLRVLIRRATPVGESATMQLFARSYQSPQDFQMDRVNIPLSATIDGFTCVSVITPKTDEGHSYKLAAHFA